MIAMVRIVLRLAHRYCAENAFTLSREECIAMEIVSRRFHRLEHRARK